LPEDLLPEDLLPEDFLAAERPAEPFDAPFLLADDDAWRATLPADFEA
jgi:hypothetical protein